MKNLEARLRNPRKRVLAKYKTQQFELRKATEVARIAQTRSSFDNNLEKLEISKFMGEQHKWAKSCEIFQAMVHKKQLDKSVKFV